MKKVLSIFLALAMIFVFAACGSNTATEEPAAQSGTSSAETPSATEAIDFKAGMVCIGNPNLAYDRNFYNAADAATKILAEEGINVEWIYTYDHPEGDPVATDCEDLADAGCQVVFLNSYGMEPAMLTVAPDYPEVIFCSLTNETSKSDDLPNTVNAMPSIYNGRYLAGVAAGCKLQEMIDNGEIKPEEAVIGYVGAYTYAEVLSGYTAFFLGARSVCPTATMMLEFIGDWGNAAVEYATAQDLIGRGAVIVSQHSDSTTPATAAQENGVYHIGYNIAMDDVAPEASIISSSINWTQYFVHVIECIVNGEEVEQDYMSFGLESGEVALTPLNTAIAAPGTQEKIDEAKAKLISGEIHVFDTNTFTVGGVELTEAGVDMNADFAPDEGYNAIFDGYYHEQFYKSAPQFDIQIDGIELINTAY